MKIGILKEANDTRVVMVPSVASKLIAAGHELMIESQAGASATFLDSTYEEVGVKISDRPSILQQAEILLSIAPPTDEELKALSDSCFVLAQFAPRANPEIGEQLAAKGIKAFSLDHIPRTTIAQSMDVLSSMASLAGYKAVLMAANMLPGYFPMLMTAAGTIPPARVLILGAGVAGLQAIATARRLGATVEAFDVRSAVKEEVQSLGAKFVEVEGAAEDQAAGGYAVQQTEDYQRRQKALIHERATLADVIITTANIPGRQAPLLIEAATVEAMKEGSVIIDMAAVTGGNCALTENGKDVVKHGVTIIGNSNLPATMPRDASTLLANNYNNFIKYTFKDGNAPDFSVELISKTYLGVPIETVA